MEKESPDMTLLARFQDQIISKVPHWSGQVIENPTPLDDITRPLLECAKTVYGLGINPTNIMILGKFESKIHGGSVKVRPAVEIIQEAILTGRLRTGQTVFEATSGNFGLALSMLQSLGLDVVALVSRKLQEGVIEELSSKDVRTVNLDVDICPAPGLSIDQNTAMAKATASNVREQLSQYGFDTKLFDKSVSSIEQFLARQDVIGLAKHLAKIYHGFCPEQYDNEQNALSHEKLTGPEIDQQLKTIGRSLKDFTILSTFGTGGTSTGISRHTLKKYGRKTVRVIYPLRNQDVAGIRTKEKSSGLRFYLPQLYLGQHEVDFEAARPLLRYFVEKGYDIGESSALALYACLQMLNYGTGQDFVVIIADGSGKYVKTIEQLAGMTSRYEVTVDQARSTPQDYGAVLWTHTAFAPRAEGVQTIASALNFDPDLIHVAKAKDIQAIISGRPVPDSVLKLIPREKNVLLVCMVGATSLRVAELLGEHGIKALSVTGGIMNLPAANGKSPADLVQMARE